MTTCKSSIFNPHDLQIIDTNRKIQISPMIKSKFYSNNLISPFLKNLLLLAYIKLSQGFILLIENNNLESLLFLEKQIENIFNFSHQPQNIFLVINFKNHGYDYDHDKEFSTNINFENSLNAICDKFSLNYYFINKQEIFTQFDNFISSCVESTKPNSNTCPVIKTKYEGNIKFQLEGKNLLKNFVEISINNIGDISNSS